MIYFISNSLSDTCPTLVCFRRRRNDNCRNITLVFLVRGSFFHSDCYLWCLGSCQCHFYSLLLGSCNSIALLISYYADLYVYGCVWWNYIDSSCSFFTFSFFSRHYFVDCRGCLGQWLRNSYIYVYVFMYY